MPHFMILAGYVFASMAIGISTALFSGALSMGGGLAFGGILATIGGLAHENIRRRQVQNTQTRHLLLLKKAYDKSTEELENLREETKNSLEMLRLEVDRANDRAKAASSSAANAASAATAASASYQSLSKNDSLSKKEPADKSQDKGMLKENNPEEVDLPDFLKDKTAPRLETTSHEDDPLADSPKLRMPLDTEAPLDAYKAQQAEDLVASISAEDHDQVTSVLDQIKQEMVEGGQIPPQKQAPAMAPETQDEAEERAESLIEEMLGTMGDASAFSAKEETTLPQAAAQTAAFQPQTDIEKNTVETEVERRQLMAKEVEILQTLVDKLYSEGIPEKVRKRLNLDMPEAGDMEDKLFEAPEGILPDVKAQVETDEEMLPLLREALEEKRLDVLMQPIHTLPHRKRRFFEAFPRLRTKDGETLIQEDIQDLMDEYELHTAADTLMLYRCAQVLKQNGGLEFDRAIFCNISPSTLVDVPFLRDFSDYMDKRKGLAKNIVLAIDFETADPILDDLREPMNRLAESGLRFALNNVRDFSMLDHMALGRSNVSYIKIDTPAVLAQINRHGDTRFKKVLKSLYQEEIDIIADNIASDRMLMEVMDLGVEFGQGILFGEAKPVKDPSSGLRLA